MKLTLFDKILIIHSTLNAIRGITSMPFNHIITLFEYWPFDSISGRIRLIPLILILIISCFIYYYLKRRTPQTNNNRPYEMNKCLFEVAFKTPINSQQLFLIIMSIHWIQWFIPVSCDLLDDVQGLAELSVIGKYYYLLTDTVCLTDALVLLIFNPIASILHKPSLNNNNNN
jgi:hypothetical protein